MICPYHHLLEFRKWLLANNFPSIFENFLLYSKFNLDYRNKYNREFRYKKTRRGYRKTRRREKLTDKSIFVQYFFSRTSCQATCVIIVTYRARHSLFTRAVCIAYCVPDCRTRTIFRVYLAWNNARFEGGINWNVWKHHRDKPMLQSNSNWTAKQ